MGFPRFAKMFGVCLILGALLALTVLMLTPANAATCPPCVKCATLVQPCSDTTPTLSGSLNLGGATAVPGTFTFGDNGVQSCPMVQLQVRVNNFVGPLNLTGEVRHAFCNADKPELYGKSRYCAGIELPAGPNAFLFCNYERYYTTISTFLSSSE